MFVFKAIKGFLRRHNSSSPPIAAKSKEPNDADTDADADGSPAITKVRDMAETQLHDIATKLDLSIASNPTMRSHDRPSDNFFPRIYAQFRHDLCHFNDSWDCLPWMVFDRFKEAEVYTAARDGGQLHEDQDHGSLPMHWTLCMAMTLYIVLLVTRQSLDCMMKDIQLKLKDFPHLATTPLRLQTTEMRQLRDSERKTVKGSEAFHRMLENMALELSVALGKIKIKRGNGGDGVDAGGRGGRTPISEVLRREIHKAHPQLELPDLTVSANL